MIFVNYLSTKDRERLKDIDKSITDSQSMEERTEWLTKKHELEQKRKPLHECSVEECMELTKQLYDQLQLHVRLGNRTQVKQFQSMIEGVNQRSNALYMEMNKKDLEKQDKLEKSKKAESDNDESDDNDKKGRRSTKKRATSNRWSISVDQFD